MPSKLARFNKVGLVLLLCGASNFARAEPQQVPDPNFDTRVQHPLLSRDRPRILFDEAHHNVHRADTSYRAFAQLVRNDGAQLITNHANLTRRSLTGYRILVIAGPLGAPLQDEKAAAASAFTTAEIKAVRRWVRDGGGLFLLTDHDPVASASAMLVEAFGVTPSRTVVLDSAHRLENMYPTNILATDSGGLLRPGPLSCGVHRVLVFGGQSLALQRNSIVIGVGASAHAPEGGPPTGNSQMGAFHYGRGRVVITGDMGMLSAQLMVDGDQKNPWGMNWPGIDNRQLLLNSVRWLAGHRPCGRS